MYPALALWLVIKTWCISLVSLSRNIANIANKANKANIAVVYSDCSGNRKYVLKHCASHVYCVGQSTISNEYISMQTYIHIYVYCILYYSDSWHCRLPSCGTSQSSRVTLLAPTFSSGAPFPSFHLSVPVSAMSVCPSDVRSCRMIFTPSFALAHPGLRNLLQPCYQPQNILGQGALGQIWRILDLPGLRN